MNNRDMDLKQAIQEKLKNRKPVFNPVDLEKGLRELKTELYIKRDEVKQLRADLDVANLEIQTLRSAFNNAKKSSEEHQFNLSLVLKKSRNIEEELQEKREALLKIQLQHKMTNTEIETLKEKLLKLEMEKIEFSRKIDLFESKERHNSLYHDEILKRDNFLRNSMEEINRIVTELQTEQKQAIELSKKADLAKEALEKINHLVDENNRLKKEKEQFETMYIKVNAKYEVLEELMSRDVSINMDNLITNAVFNQWKTSQSRYAAQIKEAHEIISKMSDSFNNESIANQKLVIENEKICEKNIKLKEENLMLKDICEQKGNSIEELNKKINELQQVVKAKDDLINEQNQKGIKEEAIEIID